MSDLGWAASVGAIAGGAVSIVVSSLQTSWTESRKRRGEEYNRKIDEIVGLLGRVNDLSVQYWTSPLYSPAEHVSIITKISEIYSLISQVSKEQRKLFEEEIFREHVRLYNNAITGATFGAQARHQADINIILDAAKFYTTCKDYANSCRYKWSMWHILPGHGFR